MPIIGIDPVAAIISGIQAINRIGEKRIEKEALTIDLLEELNTNLKILKDDYIKNEMPVSVIIKEIKIRKLESSVSAARRKKFDFKSLNKGPVDQSCFVSIHQKDHYQNFDTEEILYKIREKVTELKRVRNIYYRKEKWSKKVNPKMRMETILGLFLLLSNHLNYK